MKHLSFNFNRFYDPQTQQMDLLVGPPSPPRWLLAEYFMTFISKGNGQEVRNFRACEWFTYVWFLRNYEKGMRIIWKLTF